jgi:rubrerythrin
VNSSADVYRQFIEFEEKAAAIYVQLASRFSQDPQLSSFWLDMVMHEKQHAGLLQFCLCESLFAPDLPDTAEVQKLRAVFNRLEKRAAEPNLTIEEAFSLAIEMEASEINAIYCHLTTTLHSSVYLLRRKIATSLPDHIDELIVAARKFGLEEDALQELIRAKERCSGQWQSPN